MNKKYKRVFVYEYLSGGGFIPSAADPSINDEVAAAELLPLGLKMRDAMAQDLLLQNDCEVTVASSARVTTGVPAPGIEVRPHDGESAFDFVARQARQHDAAWIIAPETGGLLAQMARVVGPERWIGCEAEAIELCTGKRATLQHLAATGVLTPLAFRSCARRWVVKPDDGAGCVGARVHGSHAQANEDGLRRSQRGSVMAVEPWVEGQPLSVSLLCAPGDTQVLAINRQRIGFQADGTLSFDGVELHAIALSSEKGQAIARLGQQVGQAIPGLRGFAGIDLVWHEQRGPVLIEVNPRVTVAYAGMSAALGRNLAGEIVVEMLAGVEA
jgi:predicted ATP-grasp superfamily ATP-dependent carboligase